MLSQSYQFLQSPLPQSSSQTSFQTKIICKPLSKKRKLSLQRTQLTKSKCCIFREDTESVAQSRCPRREFCRNIQIYPFLNCNLSGRDSLNNSYLCAAVSSHSTTKDSNCSWFWSFRLFHPYYFNDQQYSKEKRGGKSRPPRYARPYGDLHSRWLKP